MDETEKLKKHLIDLLDSTLEHQGFGEIKLDIKWAKQGHKEVIITTGKQYRYILPVAKKNNS